MNAELAKGKEIELKRAEEERLKAAVIDAMGDGLVLVNMDGKITTVNPAFEKMTGYEKSELVGKESTELVQKMVKPEDLEKSMEDLITALEGKVPISGELTLISKDGREIPVTFSVAAIKDTEGKPTNLVYNIFRELFELGYFSSSSTNFSYSSLTHPGPSFLTNSAWSTLSCWSS